MKYFTIKLTKHWGLEIGLFTYGSRRIALTFDMAVTLNHDHQGLFFNLMLFVIGFEFNIYSDEHIEVKTNDNII